MCNVIGGRGEEEARWQRAEREGLWTAHVLSYSKQKSPVHGSLCRVRRVCGSHLFEVSGLSGGVHLSVPRTTTSQAGSFPVHFEMVTKGRMDEEALQELFDILNDYSWFGFSLRSKGEDPLSQMSHNYAVKATLQPSEPTLKALLKTSPSFDQYSTDAIVHPLPVWPSISWISHRVNNPF